MLWRTLVASGAAVIVACVAGGAIVIAFARLASQPALRISEAALLPVVVPMMALLVSPISILFGAIPATMALVFVGLPLHRRAQARGAARKRDYVLIGFIAGLAAAVCLAAFAAGNDELSRRFDLVAPALATASILGGVAGGGVFWWIARPVRREDRQR